MIAILTLLIFVLLVVIWSYLNGISPMPTTRKAKLAVISLFPGDVNGTIYELGSGWGTLMKPLCEHFPDKKIVGIENSPVPYLFSKLRYTNIEYGNFFNKDLSDSGLVICYLYPAAMKKLKSKFEKELKPGTWVISNTFAIPGWTPVKKITVSDIYNTPVYLYFLA